MANDLTAIREALLAWYEREKRDFPWRGTAAPYAVMVSEVMLQQTQASRVAERFPRFLTRFPTAERLAAADLADVLREWSGLGYNRRAVALREAAMAVTARGWPADVAGLERLPGIGPYTARAIASLAFGHAVGVVDTNVRRWLTRRLGAAPETLQRVADALAAAGDPADAAAWTHATMEFGARVCRSPAALCDACPISKGCPVARAAPRVAVRRQARFRGSSRAYRGTLLRLVAGAPGASLAADDAAERLAQHSPAIGPALDAGAFLRVVAGLERDRLLSVSDGDIRLGAERPVESATPGPVATTGISEKETEWPS